MNSFGQLIAVVSQMFDQRWFQHYSQADRNREASDWDNSHVDALILFGSFSFPLLATKKPPKMNMEKIHSCTGMVAKL